jgi:hypothetical protein
MTAVRPPSENGRGLLVRRAARRVRDSTFVQDHVLRMRTGEDEQQITQPDHVIADGEPPDAGVDGTRDVPT